MRQYLVTVFGLTDRQLFQIAALIYSVGLVYGVVAFRRSLEAPRWTLHAILGLGLVFHTLSMVNRGVAHGRCPVANLYEATVFTAWTISAACVALGIFKRLRFLAVFGAPVLVILGSFALLPRLDTPPPQPQVRLGIVSLHMSLTLLGYGAFGLAALVGITYLIHEHDLKTHKLRALTTALPPLELLDTTTRALMATGLVLLSAGLVMGMAWLKQTQGVFLKADPKILWAILVWIFYVSLLGLRWRYGIKGRKFALPTVGCFGFILLTYWGFSLISDIHSPN